jgi:hypothetical protein
MKYLHFFTCFFLRFSLGQSAGNRHHFLLGLFTTLDFSKLLPDWSVFIFSSNKGMNSSAVPDSSCVSNKTNFSETEISARSLD